MKKTLTLLPLLFILLHVNAQNWGLAWADEFNGTGVDEPAFANATSGETRRENLH